MHIQLNQDEQAELDKQHPSTKRDGGFQSLLVGLQERCGDDGGLDLTPTDVGRIQKYALDIGNGGWETRLKRTFSRHLGPNLGR